MAGALWGGSEELWSQAAVRFANQGHQVAASVTYWPQLSPKVTRLTEHNIDLFVRKPIRYTIPQRLWRKITHQQRRQKEFVWLRRQEPDLILISQGGNNDGLKWMNFCLEAALPFAVVIHSNTEISWPSDGILSNMVKAFRAARKVFLVCRHSRDLLQRQMGELLSNGQVIWNPYNVSPHQHPNWPVKNDTWKLACVARLEPNSKGQDLLCQVMAHSQWRNRPVEVNLYGTGPCEGSLRRLAEHLKLNNFHFRGHVDNITEIWEYNHLLVLPSRFEGLPLVLVEAMWCGRPALVTDVGGTTEMCIDGETGFVSPAPTVGLLEQTLERAWACRQNWQLMGQAARRHAEQLIPTDPVGEFCQQLMECVS